MRQGAANTFLEATREKHDLNALCLDTSGFA